MKKTIALLLALCLLFTLAACGGKGGENKGGKSTVADVLPGAASAVGDKFVMGELDGEKIAWTAVAKGVGTLLLVSDKVLMRRVFNEEENFAAKWKDSDIRAYLNGEFIESVFTEEQRALIAPTELRTTVFDFDAYRTYNEYTEDKVFLLSAREFAIYVMAINDFQYGVPTQAVLDSGVYMAETEGSETVKEACSWGLREDGETEAMNYLDVAGYDGKMSYYGNTKTNKTGIRPAMWVYTDKDLAEGWKDGTAELPADEDLNAKIAAWKLGDTVTLGVSAVRDTSAGPVEVTWKILDETDDAFLLYSDKFLSAYNLGASDDEAVTWATSFAREYMNGDEFIDSYFTPWERDKIKLTHHATCGGEPMWDVDPGPETDDYLFLLDREEIEKYYPEKEDRVAEDGPYWLRNPNFVRGWFNYVNEYGGFSDNDAPHYYGLRVAMWISK